MQNVLKLSEPGPRLTRGRQGHQARSGEECVGRPQRGRIVQCAQLLPPDVLEQTTGLDPLTDVGALSLGSHRPIVQGERELPRWLEQLDRIAVGI